MTSKITTNTPQRRRRMAREENPGAICTGVPANPRRPSKLDHLEAMLMSDGGASIAEMVRATGWQQHSVRGAMAGTLKKRGLTIASDRIDGVRRYMASRAA